eukprot:UN27057
MNQLATILEQVPTITDAMADLGYEAKVSHTILDKPPEEVILEEQAAEEEQEPVVEEEKLGWEIQCMTISMPKPNVPSSDDWLKFKFNNGVTEALGLPLPELPDYTDISETWREAFLDLDSVGSIMVEVADVSTSNNYVFDVELAFDGVGRPSNWYNLPLTTIVQDECGYCSRSDVISVTINECQQGGSHHKGYVYEVQRVKVCGDTVGLQNGDATAD